MFFNFFNRIKLLFIWRSILHRIRMVDWEVTSGVGMYSTVKYLATCQSRSFFKGTFADMKGKFLHHTFPKQVWLSLWILPYFVILNSSTYNKVFLLVIIVLGLLYDINNILYIFCIYSVYSFMMRSISTVIDKLKNYWNLGG